MHHVAIIMLLLFISYAPVYIYGCCCYSSAALHQLRLVWMVQLRAVHTLGATVPRKQLLSSYEGYKAFLRYLVSELSIKNLEFFQLSMRWRFRLVVWQFGLEHGTKAPAEHIHLPFELLTFNYMDRLLPHQEGGGLVPNADEQQQVQALGAQLSGLKKRDSNDFSGKLPVSRRGSINTTPFASRPGSRKITAHSARSSHSDLVNASTATAPSSLHRTPQERTHDGPTIVEVDEEEEDITGDTRPRTCCRWARPSRRRRSTATLR